MKIKILAIVSILAITSLIFNSCRKGEDDPWISFRSRDSRVIGKWKLKEMKVEIDSTYSSKTSNNVNADNSTYSEQKFFSQSFENGKLTETRTRINKNSSDYQYINYNEEFVHKYEFYNSKSSEIKTYTYEVLLEIKKNHTWEAVYTRKEKTIRFVYENTSITNNDTTISSSDTSFTYNETNIWEESGNWYWEDGDKDKIFINAGPMKGYLKRLANKEIIIENFNNESINDSYVEQMDLYTYDDENNPYNKKSGILTRNFTKTNKSNEYYKWVNN